jgi:glycosyltransferase involved in cell wall biosynthesis/SAM-dependent methyltransferase
MQNNKYDITPLVSVVITGYNHGHFIGRAIQSVLSQSYSNTQVIVIDDGSTDNTKSISQSFAGVIYHYQHNAGLSAARNKGIKISRGEYIMFLDADDWLYPTAVQTNVDLLIQNPSWAFVSGDHDKVDQWGNVITDDHVCCVSGNNFVHFLKGNYVGMHATVMYRRSVLDEFQFETSLKACEDYDLYLSITRKYPVGCHTQKLAAYYIHDQNMSGNVPLMLKNVLNVLHRHKKSLISSEEKKAYAGGIRNWQEYYNKKVLSHLSETLKTKSDWPTTGEMKMMFRSKPVTMARYTIKKIFFESKEVFKDKMPDRFLLTLHRIGLYKNYTLPVGTIDLGDFNRVVPFSNDFGYERGGPIDRYYIENFLHQNRKAIAGHVLEIGDNEYTLRFGDQNKLQSEILHVDSSNDKATIIGDITNLPQIPTGNFDCIILTQTLHLIYDFKKALDTCYRILKPGGVLLMTVPGITHIDKGIWKDYWLWSFTDTSMRRVMKETFNGSAIDIQTYGNVKVASAFLYGMGLPEIDMKSLNYRDPQYQVIISVKAVKS